MHDPANGPLSSSCVVRTPNGALDTDHYHRRARAERADFLRAALSCLARCGWRAWGCIQAKLDIQATRHELAALTGRELKDLGLTRDDLDAIANGAYFADPTRRLRSRERMKKCA